MNALTRGLDIRSLLHEEDIRPALILICAAALPAVHRAFGSMDFALRAFAPCSELGAALYMFGAAFLLMGVVPFFIVTVIFRGDPRSYGLRSGDWEAGMTAVASLLPVIAVLFLVPASRTAEIRVAFPLAKEALGSTGSFLVLQISRGVLYYFAWEFFFRGFVLFGLRRYVGDGIAICIQMIPQCLWHIGMPTGELFSSIAGGLLFGILALRTGSILWPFILHYAMGISLDLLILVQP